MKRVRLSPATVLASLALLVALSGTSVASVAGLAPGSVATKHLKNGAVNSAKVKDHSLKTVDLAAGVLTSGAQGEPGPAGPAGAAGPPGPSDAYARTIAGPVTIPTAALTTITTLSIPQAGSYVVWAKSKVGSGVAHSSVVCTLGAFVSSDDGTWATSDTSPWEQTISNIVVQRFEGAGTISYKCRASTFAQLTNIQIVAIRVGNLVTG